MTEYNIDKFTYNGNTYNITPCPYMIGDIYTTTIDYSLTTEGNPSAVWPGTFWIPIQDKFLLAAGNTYSAGSTGGSADATLPSHDHAVKITSNAGSSHSHGAGTLSVSPSAHKIKTNSYALGSNGTSRNIVTSSGSLSSSTVTDSHSISGSTGGESAHTHLVDGTSGTAGTSATGANMPPYFTVYMWERVEVDPNA